MGKNPISNDPVGTVEVVGLMTYSWIYMQKPQRLTIIALSIFNNLKGTFLTTGIERERGME